MKNLLIIIIIIIIFRFFTWTFTNFYKMQSQLTLT